MLSQEPVLNPQRAEEVEEDTEEKNTEKNGDLLSLDGARGGMASGLTE